MTYTRELSVIVMAIASLAVLALLVVPAVSLAGAPEKTDGFVCPVFNSDSAAGARNPNAELIGGGDYSIIGPEVSVPVHATNGNGAGAPFGDHSSPGDSDYSAIWAVSTD